MRKITLEAQWVLSGEKYKNLPAIIPGCVHNDLKRNGIIPDYFWRDNNDSCQWIENEDWTYSCSFDFDEPKKQVVLVFEGLDTYATVVLNGEELGKTHNMFIPHSFDVKGKLKKENNILEVHFRSPIKEIAHLPERMGAFTRERFYSRRMQCTYFWDWVDRFVTCGIFAPVYFKIGEDFCVENTYIYTQSIDDFGAQMHIIANFTNYEKSSIVKFEISDPTGKVVYIHKQYVSEPRTVLFPNIQNPYLWWPNGYGEHPLYTLRIYTGENIHEEKFGIRTLRVAEIPDAKGGDYNLLSQRLKEIRKNHDFSDETAGFTVIVNGRRIFCRGGNWVPCEPFPSEESDEKIIEIIRLAQKAKVNMLRVWGGGLFEKEVFYDECDKRGILVTQDFLMACGDYPQDEEWFLEELKKESSFAVKKLRNHPCLAWWSGDNECGMGGSDMVEKYDGRVAALEGSAPQVHELDFSRRFHNLSPYGGTPYRSFTRGTTHTSAFLGYICDFIFNTNCMDYKENLNGMLARFIVEEPIYGTPQKSTLLRFMTEADLRDESEKILRTHCKSNPELDFELFDFGRTFADKIFGGFHNLEDKLFKYEYLQYEWIRVVFENCRRNIGYNDGIIFWMLNDCWPASMGWSIIDYYNLPKAGWYSFKRCAKRVIGSIVKENEKLILYISSDGASGDAEIVCHTLEKTCFYKTSVSLSGYGSVRLELPFEEKTDFAICDICFEGEIDRCFYKDGILPLKQIDAIQIIAQTESFIKIRATDYIHAVYLEGDYIFTDNYFSMLLGEERTIFYQKAVGDAQSSALSVNAFTIERISV